MRIMDQLYFQSTGLDMVPDQVLVKVRKGQLEQFIERVSLIGLRILKSMNLLAGDFVIVKTSPKPILGVINLLGDLPEVEYAEPNYTTKSAGPKVQSIEGEPWQRFTVKQAAIDVIDAKIELDLPRVNSQIEVNRQKIGDPRKNDFVDVSIKDLLFLSDAVPVNLAEAVQVIDYATKMEVDIVSNSWVRDGFSKALDDAIKVAERKGVSFVAAAGIAASMGAGTGAMADYQSDHEFSQQDTKLTSPNVSAGILSLYIAQEAKEGRSGRGRLLARSIPSDEQIRTEWQSGSLEEPIGKLRLQNDIKVSQNYTFPGAKFLKLEIAKLNSATNLDLIRVRNSSGVLIQNISTSSEYFETDYIATSLVTVEFHSNSRSTSIGSVIRNVRVIY